MGMTDIVMKMSTVLMSIAALGFYNVVTGLHT